MTEAELQVREVYPMALCAKRARYKRDGRMDTVYEIFRHPFPNDSDKRPVSNACLTPAAAWESAAKRLAKIKPPTTTTRERIL